MWLGQSTVAALTTAGKIYTLPKQTGAPVGDFMKRLNVSVITHPCSTAWEAHLAVHTPGAFYSVAHM